MQGQVVGIIAFTMRSGQNLNFAVPISYAFPLLQSPKSLTLAQLSARLSGSGEAHAESKARPPLTASDQYRLGLDFYGKNKQHEAIEAFKKAIELDPNQAESYFQIGSILADEPHSRDQAISYLQEGTFRSRSSRLIALHPPIVTRCRCVRPDERFYRVSSNRPTTFGSGVGKLHT